MTSAPFPGVLIAKACSHDSRDLDMVLYPSTDPGTFSLTVSRLQPGQNYKVLEKKLVADDKGDVTFPVAVNGRTVVHLVPIHASE